MVSGIPTASGYEERIRFSEMEVVDRGAQEQGLMVNAPDGNTINGWDMNVVGVNTVSVKRTVRHHQHSQFIIRVRKGDQSEIYIGRRYGEFARLHRALRTELPGKVLPPLPRKNKTHTAATLLHNDEDDDSISSESASMNNGDNSRLNVYNPFRSSSHSRSRSNVSTPDVQSRNSVDSSRAVKPEESFTLHREEQRISLRAFLRTILQNQQVAESKAMRQFLSGEPLVLNAEERQDIERRKAMDEKRIEEQRQFYEIARRRAEELDVYMEKFRRDIVERSKDFPKSWTR